MPCFFFCWVGGGLVFFFKAEGWWDILRLDMSFVSKTCVFFCLTSPEVVRKHVCRYFSSLVVHFLVCLEGY